VDLGEAHTQLILLRSRLEARIKRDPDDEIDREATIRVLDSLLSEIRKLVPDHAVMEELRDVISVESITEGAPIRTADLLIEVDALYGAIAGPYTEWMNSQPIRYKS
jgi:hypothetical protein